MGKVTTYKMTPKLETGVFTCISKDFLTSADTDEYSMHDNRNQKCLIHQLAPSLHSRRSPTSDGRRRGFRGWRAGGLHLLRHFRLHTL